MTGYIIRRLFGLIFVLFAVATIVFFLMYAVPGGPFSLGERGYDAIALANDQHRLDGWAGGYGNFFETFCVSIGSDELWFGVRHGGGGGPCEAQWDGIWSPYDYRDKNGFPYLDPDLYISLFLNDL